MKHLFRWCLVVVAALACALACPAHAQKTKAQLNTEINTQFPDNSSGAITPSILRGVAADTVNSIMPTAPVVSGNAAVFDGTTGLLKDSGAPPGGGRTLLTGNLTMFVRGDGSDTACTGLSNSAYISGSFPQACAKATWNVLYITVAETLDFAGGTVTLKSGTTNTYTAGLFMDTAWVGGGSLIIDLNGSNIAETVTKGIINNQVQPGRITIQNSAGLGVGGVISSTGFACVQNSAPSIMNIGAGITTGPCFDASYEATQGATIALSAAVNVKGGGGNELVLTAFNSNFGFNGQTVNICSNQTYSLATVVAQFGSGVTANSAVFNLNPACGGGPFTVTGPRYSVTQNGYIYTAAAGPSFLPGTTSGAAASNSGGCYDLECYGSLADGTAVLGSLLVTNIAAPGNPAAGKISVYGDSTANTLQAKTSVGAIASMVYAGSVPANQFVNGLSAATGSLTSAQPSLSNLSGWGTNVLAAAGNTLNAASGLVGFNGNIGTTATGHASLDLALTGGTMSGSIAMGGNNLTGVGTLNATGIGGFGLGGTITGGGNSISSVVLGTSTLDTASNTFKINGTTATTAPDFQSTLKTGVLQAKITGVDFNSANTDNSISLPLPTGFTRAYIVTVTISNASGTLTTATAGVFSGAGGTGTTLVANSAITVSTASANTANNMQQFFPSTSTAFSFSSVFFRVGTAQGAARTGDVTVSYYPLS